jgi:HEAT repeat protein
LEGEVVVPTLVTGLDHPDVKVRKASAKALGLLGKDAQSAVRALMSAGGDPLLGISEEVNVALHAIEVDRNRPTPLFEFSEDGIYYRADAPLNGEK